MSSQFLETTIDKFILRVKKGLRYSNDDVWVKKENEQYSLGLTDYAQRRGGDIVFLEFQSTGSIVEAGGMVASYETIKAALDVKAPFDCGITELNHILAEQPELINEDPYGKGWIARVKPVRPESFEALSSPEEYFELMKEKAEAALSTIKGS
jgi:glycine cleavage system H protein